MPISQNLAIPGLRDAPHAVEAPLVDISDARSASTERKLATVVFIDVHDSMGLSRAIELEDWWSISAGLFELVCEGVERFTGWPGPFTGDGVNAVFEARGERDHHARRACLAALWLRDAIGAMAGELRAAYGVELSIRIGIHSGELMTGTMRHRRRHVYTANGYTVALAKRMEALALPHHIYVTEHTAALVGDVLALDDLGAVSVKGAESPIRVFELIGEAISGDRAIGETCPSGRCADASTTAIASRDLSTGG